MTKHLLSLAAAAAMALTASAQVNFTFGTSLDGWNFGDNAELKDGHVVVDMPGGNGSKYRQDFKWNGSDLTIDPATDKVFAFKFIGDMPMANYSFELRDPNAPEGVSNTIAKNNFRRNSNTANTLETRGGNYVLYVDLSGDATYAQWTEAFTPTLFQMKVADVAADAEVHTYTIDWIKSFASLDDLKANLNIADDENDNDEGEEEKAPVVNSTSGVSYNSLTEALNASAEGDEIVINEDQTISSRYQFAHTVTISGATGAEIISPANNNYIVFLVPNGTVVGDVYFKNLVIAGCGKSTNAAIFEINKGQNTAHFENVTFKDFEITNGKDAIQQKNAGKAVMKNVKFDNVTVQEGKSMIAIGDNCATTISGEISNASVYLERANSKLYAEGEVTGTPVAITLGAERNVGDVVVYGTTDTQMFTLTNDQSLFADTESNNLVIDDGTLGISGIEMENAPAEYYNLQGVKVAEPTPGLYIMRQGGKTTKVIVK